MLVLRLLAILLVIAIAASTLIGVLTGDRRYLALAWRLFRYGLVVAFIFFALLILERVALVPLAIL